MISLDDAAFLDDLESRVYQHWSEEDTLRLWTLGGWAVPPAGIRAYYSRAAERRLEMIAQTRAKHVQAMLARMTK